LNVTVSSNKELIKSADALILPGVGAFGEAMKSLRENNLIELIYDFINTGKPFLGICLGMQLLFTQSEEFGINYGLNLIKGKIVKFPKLTEKGIKNNIPQIQWNKIYNSSKSSWLNSPFNKINSGEFMYFVHSFYAVPEDINLILSYTEYAGIKYASSVRFNNILGIQFHPEKSGEKGILIYQEWANYINRNK
jgi:glutamine amidotransferase